MYIGSFAVFGYRKDPLDRHRLLVDDYAAEVVRDIFQWKLDGLSVGDIAARLSASGIPTPMDYKQSQGMNYSTSFRIKEKSEWSAGMILRILKNPVYTGVLEQGRVTTPSYRVKRLVNKPREEWAIVENCHEAIICTPTKSGGWRMILTAGQGGSSRQPPAALTPSTMCQNGSNRPKKGLFKVNGTFPVHPRKRVPRSNTIYSVCTVVFLRLNRNI